MISNEKTEDVMEVVKSLKESGLLIKSASKITENETTRWIF